MRARRGRKRVGHRRERHLSDGGFSVGEGGSELGRGPVAGLDEAASAPGALASRAPTLARALADKGGEPGSSSDPAAIIVIGASAGGVEALRTVVAGLPVDIDAAVFVTLHIGAHQSNLPWLLGRSGALPASHPPDGEAIGAGRIYVAPPDHHLLVERGVVRLTKGPRENWARPAIDPMFRSAARSYGARVIGVVLTGGLNDGTAGLYEVKANGGTAVVQDPGDCVSTDMTASAIAHVEVDHVRPAAGIGALLADLVAARAASPPVATPTPLQEGDMTAQFTLDPPVAVTCPDCGGALRRSELGRLTQFSCHIGHVYTVEVMLAAQFLALERFIEQAMRSLSERAELCRDMATKLPDDAAHADQRARWEAARGEAIAQTAPLRAMLTRKWLHPVGGAAVEGTGA